MAGMRKADLVFVPAPGVGHLVSTVALANLLINRNDHLSITIFIMTRPSDTNLVAYRKSLEKSSDSRIRYIDLRPEPIDPSEVLPGHQFIYQFVDSHKPHVREIFTEMSESKTSKLAGLIVDMFCASIFDVAKEFGVPSYVFYASGAAFLGMVLHLQSLRDDFNEDVYDYNNSRTEIIVPTYVNPVPTKVIPSTIYDRTGGGKKFLDVVKRYREAKGIIINTFQELESHAIDALSKDPSIPLVYPVGPMLNLKTEVDEDHHNTMKWLDLQPDSSVVFLCFGSAGAFDAEQVKEMAHAIEKSGFRFIWSLRKPPPPGKKGYPDDYENLDDVLPEGFLTRTSELGRIIGWAPQAAILSHSSVGGFVSHCGWNSTLESVWCGVPIATWPICAEQQMNAFHLVKDLGMAVEIKMDYRKHLRGTAGLNSEDVSADVIEKAIRVLMEPESEVRKKVKEMQEKSRVVLEEGGSSCSSLNCFIDDVLSNVV